MNISFIAAISDNYAIGKGNQLPWHLPEDLKFFKRTTLGKPVLMGRKTFDSLGRALPGRLNIVLSGNKDLALPDGVLLYHDVGAALRHLENEEHEELFIIGGGKLFAETMRMADTLYITRVHTQIPDADAFFPHIDATHWHLVWQEPHEADDKNAYPYTFQQYSRIAL